MQYRRFTKNDVIHITREAIHLFIHKQIDKFVEYLDNSFVFIGDYHSLFLHGIPEFLNYIKEESELPPVDIAQEEYEIITHERHLWTSCGRYIASFNSGEKILVSKHHFTFTWKQVDNDLKLIHAMACHVKDFPAENDLKKLSSEPVQAKIFDNIPPQPADTSAKQKISIRDINGKIRYLYSDEIIYIKADDKICHIYMETEFFSARITLNELKLPDLLFIHKSYRVNRKYIKEICRYQATLTNGLQIPIGKSRYMDIKKLLES
jgi:hypothetical protein